MAEIRNLTRNGETFYPLTHEKAVIGMEDFKDTITEQIDNYRPIEITGNVTNAPDEEDITSDANNFLKFKNRNNLYGLGKVILRRGSSFASQVTQANTIYVIQYNFDLGGARVNIPNGSILMFEGGTLSNGTLVCADLYDVRLVYYQDISVILNSVTLEGNFIYKACDKDTIGGISVDNSSIEENELGQLTVKAGGIQNTHLNSSIVDNSGITLDSNNKISIKDGGVTNSKLGSSIVDNSSIGLDTNNKISIKTSGVQGINLNSNIVNTDDLVYDNINHNIKFANREYNSLSPNGMGRVILRNNLVEGVNTLTQDMMPIATGGNTIYIIRYDFTICDGTVDSYDASSLGIQPTTVDGIDYHMVPVNIAAGKAIMSYLPIFNSAKTKRLTDSQVYCAEVETTIHLGFPAEWEVKDAYRIFDFISIPNNCILQFEGGSIKGGVVKFNNTQLILTDNSFNDCLFSGTIKGDEVSLSAFGPKCTAGEDDSWLLNSIIDICNDNGVEINLDFKGNLYISKPSDLAYPYCYGIRNEVHCKSNTHLRQTSSGWITLQNSTNGGGVIYGGDNSEFYGLKVDGNNKYYYNSSVDKYYGENGIGGHIIRDCIVKNCVCGPDKLVSNNGGKGIVIDSDNTKTFVTNCHVYDCSIGIMTNRQIPEIEDNKFLISNCIIERCNIAIAALNLFNLRNESHPDSVYETDGIQINNCIIKDTIGDDGVFNFAGVRYINITDCIITGNNKVSSIFRGECQYSKFDILIRQTSTYLIDRTQSRIWTYSTHKLNNRIRSNEYRLVMNAIAEVLIGHSEGRSLDGTVLEAEEMPGNTIYMSGYGEPWKISDSPATEVALDGEYGIILHLNTRQYQFDGMLEDLLMKTGGYTALNVNIAVTGKIPVCGTLSARPMGLTNGAHYGKQYYAYDVKKLIVWDGTGWYYTDGTPVT